MLNKRKYRVDCYVLHETDPLVAGGTRLVVWDYARVPRAHTQTKRKVFFFFSRTRRARPLLIRDVNEKK